MGIPAHSLRLERAGDGNGWRPVLISLASTTRNELVLAGIQQSPT